MTSTTTAQEQAPRILHAVERILAPSEVLLEKVTKWRAGAKDDVKLAAAAAIAEYSDLSCAAGAAAAAPAVIPGFGTAAVLLASPIADMIYTLKLQTELGLCLSAIHGFDITSPAERQVVMLLACLKQHEAYAPGPIVLDSMRIAGAAIWNYTDREIAKVMLGVTAALVVLFMTRGLFRAAPLVGIAISAGLNKLTMVRAGKAMNESLITRKGLLGAAA